VGPRGFARGILNPSLDKKDDDFLHPSHGNPAASAGLKINKVICTMKISIIAALTKNYVIGLKNQIPWHLPADFAYFKKITLNKTVIMGRKTFESIGKALPQRENIIVTHNPNYKAKQCKIAVSLKDAIRQATTKEIFIIGGQSLYREALSLADQLYLTFIDIDCKGDRFFPKIDMHNWHEIKREQHKADMNNPYDYSFVVLARNKKH